MKITLKLSDEHLKSMVFDATKLFFRSHLPVDEDSVEVTRSEGRNCVDILAKPRAAHDILDFFSIRDVINNFNPSDAYYNKETEMLTLTCVNIGKLGAELEVI